MDEITQVDEMWMAKEIETSPKQCALNRNRRIRALNLLYFDDTHDSDPYHEWMVTPSEYSDTNLVCLCGKKISKCDVMSLKIDAGIKVCIGSECVKRIGGECVYREGSVGNDYYTNYQNLRETCPTCGEPKCKKYTYCGNEVCSKCIHGQREYWAGPSSSGKSAWFCPHRGYCESRSKCDPLWVSYSERAPVTKTKKNHLKKYH
jgi:hypothetical protein